MQAFTRIFNMEYLYYFIFSNRILLTLIKILIGLLGGSDSKVSACNAGDPGSIPGLGDPLEKEMATHSNTLAWKISWMEPGTVRGVAKSQTRLSDFTSFLHVLSVFDSVCFILFLMQHLQM